MTVVSISSDVAGVVLGGERTLAAVLVGAMSQPETHTHRPHQDVKLDNKTQQQPNNKGQEQGPKVDNKGPVKPDKKGTILPESDKGTSIPTNQGQEDALTKGPGGQEFSEQTPGGQEFSEQTSGEQISGGQTQGGQTTTERGRRKLENEDSSYDSDFEPCERPEDEHEDVCRTVSDTLGAEFAEYVNRETINTKINTPDICTILAATSLTIGTTATTTTTATTVFRSPATTTALNTTPKKSPQVINKSYDKSLTTGAPRTLPSTLPSSVPSPSSPPSLCVTPPAPSPPPIASGNPIVAPNAQKITLGQSTQSPNAQKITLGQSTQLSNTHNITLGQSTQPQNAQKVTLGQSTQSPNAHNITLVSQSVPTPSSEEEDKSPRPNYASQVEFGVKLGYSENLVQLALGKIGGAADKDEFLAELIRLGTNATRSEDDATHEDSPDAKDDAETQQQQTQQQQTLKPIIIDGSNVAMSHGNKTTFSCRGLRVCIDWFHSRGHTEITVFVPAWRKEATRWDTPIVDQEILLELERERLLVFTPSRVCGGKRIVSYDDRYILNEAMQSGGIIVSNDNYRDLAAESAAFRRIVEENLLMYSWVNGRFVPPDDPLGRSGPTLDAFLRRVSRDKQAPCPYGRKCTYGNKCKYMHPERGTAPLKSVTERLQERAQRHYQNKQQKSRDSSPGDALRGKSLSLPVGLVDNEISKKPLSRTMSNVPVVSLTFPSALTQETPLRDIPQNMTQSLRDMTQQPMTQPMTQGMTQASHHHLMPPHHDPRPHDQQRIIDQRTHDPQRILERSHDPQRMLERAHDPQRIIDQRTHDPQRMLERAHDPRTHDPRPHDRLLDHRPIDSRADQRMDPRLEQHRPLDVRSIYKSEPSLYHMYQSGYGPAWGWKGSEMGQMAMRTLATSPITSPSQAISSPNQAISSPAQPYQHLPISKQLSDPDASSDNPHRKLQRQLTLNPAYDSRLYKIVGFKEPAPEHFPISGHAQGPQPSQSSPSRTVHEDMVVSPGYSSPYGSREQLQVSHAPGHAPGHTPIARHSSQDTCSGKQHLPPLAPHLYPTYPSHPQVTRFASAPDPIWGQGQQNTLVPSMIQRPNSTSDTRLDVYGESHQHSHQQSLQHSLQYFQDDMSRLPPPFPGNAHPHGPSPAQSPGPIGSRPMSPQQGLHHSPSVSPRQHSQQTPQHGIQTQQQAQTPQHSIPQAQNPQHNIPQHNIPQPQTPQHNIPQPQTPQHNIQTPQHNIQTPQHNIQTPQHNIQTPQHNIQTPQHNIPQAQTPQHIQTGIQSEQQGPITPQQQGNFTTPLSCSNTHEDIRLRVFYHLSNLFPEAQVRAVMAKYPEETDPQKICGYMLGGSANPRPLSPLSPQTVGAAHQSAASLPLAPPSHEDARFRAFYHLSQLFPEAQVRAVLARHPEGTDPQQFCAALLSLLNQS